MKPKSTGTRMTSSWIVVTPRSRQTARLPALQLLFLVATGSYEFGGFIVFVRLLGLLLLDGRQERQFVGGQLGLFAGRQWAHEMRRDHYQQFTVGFLGRPAAEQLTENRDISEEWNSIQDLRDPVVDQPRNGEAFAVPKHHLGFSAPRG